MRDLWEKDSSSLMTPSQTQFKSEYGLVIEGMGVNPRHILYNTTLKVLSCPSFMCGFLQRKLTSKAKKNFFSSAKGLITFKIFCDLTLI